MGPLQLADFIGLDTCLYIMETLHEGFGDSKYRPCPLLAEICQSRMAREEIRTRFLRVRIKLHEGKWETMDLTFTEEQEMMRKMVRDFAKKEIAPFIDRWKRENFRVKFFRKMGELGLMGIPVPEEYGGAGMDFVSYIIAIHELSKVSATVGVILSVHTSVGTNPIIYFGNDEQKQRYLPKLGER